MTATSSIVGVTGHINFNESGMQEFKFTVNNVLSDLEKKYATCLPSLACGFAAGADLEVASIALARKWPLIAVLAGPQKEFEVEHTLVQTKALYSQLLAATSEIIVAAPSKTISPDKYCMVGDKIIELSDQLIAVWDGNSSSPKRGGAAWVINRFLTVKTQGNSRLHQIIVTR